MLPDPFRLARYKMADGSGYETRIALLPEGRLTLKVVMGYCITPAVTQVEGVGPSSDTLLSHRWRGGAFL